MRITAPYPLRVSYIDPLGQQTLKVSGSAGSGSFTISASLSWFAALYTINASTINTVSSISSSTSVSASGGAVSGSASVNVDGRFTNLTWNVTPGDYMFLSGQTLSVSATRNGGTTNMSLGATNALTDYGATHAQLSYSFPYFGNGSVNGSSGSYQLTQITNSGGTAVTSVCPYIHFVGS